MLDCLLSISAKYAPLGIFAIAILAFLYPSLFAFILLDPLTMINPDHTAGPLCMYTIPRFLTGLSVFMILTFTWILVGWSVVHLRNFQHNYLADKGENQVTTFTLAYMAQLHYLESELWFSIILFALTFSILAALSNVFFLKCDYSIINLLRTDVFQSRNTWVVVFEHAMPLISLNGFALAAIVLGFLWARRNYQAHSHNKIILGHKATYWTMITTLDAQLAREARPMDAALYAELLKEVIKVSPSSGYEEGAQAVQVVGMVAGKSP